MRSVRERGIGRCRVAEEGLNQDIVRQFIPQARRGATAGSNGIGHRIERCVIDLDRFRSKEVSLFKKIGRFLAGF